ncbi:flavodoxin family protein [Harryflintia acetispora]|uniref:Multimeric flavodoxin WrbA n=1 Tax=Harryflintia acetispora TaxID=1849041 RepID=A0A9X8UHS5_9FIRM|nr:flavodoxin family protein [Harryflintia acetispora]TCL42325.1 multimeric flavodoxin WrbA [Harryflintia acetispora]
MSRIIAVNGSARQNGTTAKLLSRFLDECEKLGAETHLLHVGALMRQQRVPFCTACSSPCLGQCTRGTGLEEAYELLASSDAVMIGTPVYYSNVSAQLKAFFDKSRFWRLSGAFTDLLGAVLVTGGATYGGQENTAASLHAMMLVHGMIIIGDGAREADPGHHALYGGPEADNDPTLLARLPIVARRMVGLCGNLARSGGREIGNHYR